jgi:hypothetical protein
MRDNEEVDLHRSYTVEDNNKKRKPQKGCPRSRRKITKLIEH